MVQQGVVAKEARLVTVSKYRFSLQKFLCCYHIFLPKLKNSMLKRKKSIFSS